MPPHTHPDSDEIIVLVSGQGRFTLGESALRVFAPQALFIPRGTPHAFEVTGSMNVEAVQIYDPAGPERRFQQWPQATSATD